MCLFSEVIVIWRFSAESGKMRVWQKTSEFSRFGNHCCFSIFFCEVYLKWRNPHFDLIKLNGDCSISETKKITQSQAFCRLSFFSRWCEKTPLSRDVYTLDRNKTILTMKTIRWFREQKCVRTLFQSECFSKWRNFHFKRLCFDCSICWFCFLGILHCKK